MQAMHNKLMQANNLSTTTAAGTKLDAIKEEDNILPNFPGATNNRNRGGGRAYGGM
jgi:hypothetical protein